MAMYSFVLLGGTSCAATEALGAGGGGECECALKFCDIIDEPLHSSCSASSAKDDVGVEEKGGRGS